MHSEKIFYVDMFASTPRGINLNRTNKLKMPPVAGIVIAPH
jgi:hypothetical protein